MTVWVLRWDEPCGCCTGVQRFALRREARAAIPRLSRPWINVAGKVTKLVNTNFRIVKETAPPAALDRGKHYETTDEASQETKGKAT